MKNNVLITSITMLAVPFIAGGLLLMFGPETGTTALQLGKILSQVCIAGLIVVQLYFISTENITDIRPLRYAALAGAVIAYIPLWCTVFVFKYIHTSTGALVLYITLAHIVLVYLTFEYAFIRDNIRNLRNELMSKDKYRPVIEKLSTLYSDIEEATNESQCIDAEYERINTMYTTVQKINAEMESAAMITICHEVFSELLEHPNYALFLIDPARTELVLMKSNNLSDEMKDYLSHWQHRVGNDTSLLKRFHDVQEYCVRLDIDYFHAHLNTSLENIITTPLKVQDEFIGLVFIFTQSKLKDSEIRSLHIARNQLSLGLRKTILYQKVTELSMRDGLTKLFLHRVFQEKLQYEFSRAKRYKAGLSLIMIDIDHFKNFNDTYGHITGDVVLVKVADTIRELQNDAMHAARYGGEEFAIICPLMGFEESKTFAEELRKAIENMKVVVDGIAEPLQVTISLGIAVIDDTTIQVPEMLVKKADDALYKAKESGRNRVCYI